MSTNYFQSLWKTSIDLHRITDCHDLNFYYERFLRKLNQQYLKILLPLIFIVYVCPLLFSRLFIYQSIDDIRTSLCFLFSCVILSVCLLIRLHIKWKTTWIFIRSIVALLLLIPLLLTYQTQQYHLIFAIISILLTYSFLIFTLVQSFILAISISILHVTGVCLQRSATRWTSLQLCSIVFYHVMIHIIGIYAYVTTIERIRQQFYAYKTILYEKNQAHIDCKKLQTMMNYCRRESHSIVHNK
jgi:hypothetical protein